MDVSKIYKRNIKYRKRKIANRFILMGMKKNFEINEIGSFIWEHLDGDTILASIIDLILEEYDINRNIIEVDVISFVKFLHENEIIEEVEHVYESK